MKTNGPTHARALHRIFLSLIAVITLSPAFAQANFASLKTSSLTGQDKRSASAYQDVFALTEPSASSSYNASTSYSAAATAKNITNAEETPFLDIHETKTNIAIAENTTVTNSIDNAAISFRPTSFAYPANARVDVGIAEFPDSLLLIYARSLKQYARKNGFDTSYAFFSNMGMLCNKKRFFVVNLETMVIVQSGLVSHGRGQGVSVYEKQYSNQTGSRCTSLGRYKIAGKYTGGYGQSYKVIGLDSTNKNAYSRSIVLHSMGCIPDKEGYMPACVSEGCPAVSPNFLSTLSKFIDSRKKPILLWIFDSNLEKAVIEGVFEKPGPHHVCAIHPDNDPSTVAEIK